MECRNTEFTVRCTCANIRPANIPGSATFCGEKFSVMSDWMTRITCLMSSYSVSCVYGKKRFQGEIR